jgi:hypothetical protein
MLPNDIDTLRMHDIRKLSVFVLIAITNNGKHYGTVRFVCSVAVHMAIYSSDTCHSVYVFFVIPLSIEKYL